MNPVTQYDYERTLSELLGFLGKPVQVLMGPEGGEHLHASFSGVVTRGEGSPIWAHAGGAEEAIEFNVGESASFVIYRRASTYGEDESTNGMQGLSINQEGMSLTVWYDRGRAE